jgi:hypothetical protein
VEGGDHILRSIIAIAIASLWSKHNSDQAINKPQLRRADWALFAALPSDYSFTEAVGEDGQADRSLWSKSAGTGGLDIVGCEHKGSPVLGSRPTAILKIGSHLRESQSSASS